MSQQAQAVVHTQQKAAVKSSIKGGILQRKCACGQHTIAGGECEECRQKGEGMIQRTAVSPAPVNAVPPIVHDVLSSPGQTLDAGTRAFMEPRFGHDFSQVRVHSAMSNMIQIKLTINQPGDEYEQEADRVAEQVIQRSGTSTEKLDRRAAEKREPLHAKEVPDQKNREISVRTNRLGEIKLRQSTGMQRKLAIHSKAEAEAFEWFLTEKDARNYQYSGVRGKPLNITMKSATPSEIEDAFRFNILKTIITHPTETLLIQHFALDQKVTPHQLFKDGKLDKTNVKISLREMAGNILGAGGVTIPSPGLALASDSSYTGPVTGIANESWIFYSTPTSLAHEFGHAFLLFSGTSLKHTDVVPSSANILTPEGTIYEGPVIDFITGFVEEKYAELPLFDPDALHFSPTRVREWPEPDSKVPFKGTWLQFLAKHPGAKVSQKVTLKKGKKERSFQVCVPKKGEICP